MKIFNEECSTNEPEVIKCRNSKKCHFPNIAIQAFFINYISQMVLDTKSTSSDEEKSYDSTISQSGDMSWQKATFVLLSETIAIGVLSMPSACHRIGVMSEEYTS